MKPKAKYLLVFIPVLALSLYVPLTADAVYSVHDSKVYKEVVMQVKKVTEQINTIRQQIELEKQHLYDVSWKKVGPLLKEVKKAQEDYTKLRGSMNGIMSGQQDVESAFRDTFADWNNIDVVNTSYGDLKRKFQQDQYQIRLLDRQTVELINFKQKEIEASNKRIQKYQEMLKDAHGEKDTAQLNALITGEQVYSQNLMNDINVLKSKLEVVRNEHKKQEKEASIKMNEKVASDFGSAAKELKELSENMRPSNSYSSKFEQLADEKGWN